MPFFQDFMAYPHIAMLVGRAPRMLDPENPLHVLVFKNVLKIAMLQGRWAGKMPLVS